MNEDFMAQIASDLIGAGLIGGKHDTFPGIKDAITTGFDASDLPHSKMGEESKTMDELVIDWRDNQTGEFGIREVLAAEIDWRAVRYGCQVQWLIVFPGRGRFVEHIPGRKARYSAGVKSGRGLRKIER